MTNERNPHAVWLRQFAEFIRDAISPSEKQRLQHCADLIDGAAIEPEADRCECGRFYEQRCPVCGPFENRT